tara:strand:- start:26 stop:280 length:255 start_codon:yes stop_codon:yes gene_type:complete
LILKRALPSVIFTFLGTAFFVVSCQDDDADNSCYNSELQTQYDTINCDLINEPVCACNNVTYLNACLAYQAGFEVVDSVPCNQR